MALHMPDRETRHIREPDLMVHIPVARALRGMPSKRGFLRILREHQSARWRTEASPAARPTQSLRGQSQSHVAIGLCQRGEQGIKRQARAMGVRPPQKG